MKNLATIFLATALPFAALAQTTPLPVQLDRTHGGTGDDRGSVALGTADGGLLLGGTSASGAGGTRSQASFGGQDYWVVKLDASGTRLWDFAYGGANDDRLVSAVQTADGGYLLAGSSNSGAGGSKSQGSQGGFDLWLVKLDAAGQKVWDRSYGSSGDDFLKGAYQTTDGGYVVEAQSGSGINGDRSTAGQGGLDYWVLKLDGTGAKTWDRSLGGPDNDIAGAVLPTADGGYLLGGFSYSPAGGDKSQGTRGTADYDYWVVKVNGTGQKVWDGTYGGAGFDNLTTLAATPDGGYLLGGFSNSPVGSEKSQAPRGDYDYWAVKVSATGTKVWDFTYGGDGYDSLNGVLATADGGYLLAGQSNSALSGDKTQANVGGPNSGFDYWLVKLTATGTKSWDGSYGGPQDDVLASARQLPDGGYLLGGFSNSGAGGSKTQASFGSYDYWAVRLRPATLATAPAAALPALALYPNPTAGAFTVQLPAAAPRTGLLAALLDATGRLVWQQPATPAEGGLSLAPAGLAPGLYLLRLQGPDGYQQSQRLVLE